MRRTDRLLRIIQILRRHRRPVTGRLLADELEISLRTLYRDMVALEASGVPIMGEAGVGYVLGDGFDLPPLMFTATELEAIMLGARLVESKGDSDLVRAAQDVVAKVSAVLHPSLRPILLDASLFPLNTRVTPSDRIPPEEVRRAVREARKVELTYRDEAGNETKRVVWPFAIAYFEAARLLAAWCELRQDFRHFRTDRIMSIEVLEQHYPERRAILLRRWHALMNNEARAKRCDASNEDHAHPAGDKSKPSPALASS